MATPAFQRLVMQWKASRDASTNQSQLPRSQSFHSDQEAEQKDGDQPDVYEAFEDHLQGSGNGMTEEEKERAKEFLESLIAMKDEGTPDEELKKEILSAVKDGTVSPSIGGYLVSLFQLG